MSKILFLVVFVLLTCIGPVWLIASKKIDFHADWRTAERLSAHIAADPKMYPDAIVQVYEARAFNWRGLFAVHTWLAVKPQNAEYYMVYQVIGWRAYAGYTAVVITTDIPDRAWFGQKPKLIKEYLALP